MKHLSDIELCRRLDAALKARITAQKAGELKEGELTDVTCEVCGDNIHRYRGMYPGIICSTCHDIGLDRGGCTRIMPLAITRGTLNE